MTSGLSDNVARAGENSSREFEIESDGARLDSFLAAQLGVSRARAQTLVETAQVNGAAAKGSHKLKSGDIVVLAPPEQAKSIRPSFGGHPEFGRTFSAELPPIIYEDEFLIVLNKPRGMVVHPGAGNERETLVDVLRAAGKTLSTVGPIERAGIVHRLDKDTSGLIVVCKTDAAHWKLAADFAERRVEKHYAALVCGVPPLRGRIEAPIARHPRDRKKMAIVREGRNAVTEYVVEKSWTRFALLDVNLLTGRTHQIRVHLAHIGHPVAGDETYSGQKRALQSAPGEPLKSALENLFGQALHAAKLSFSHPISGEELKFAAPLPPEMQAIIDALEMGHG